MPATTEPTYLRPAISTALGSILAGLTVTCAFVATGGHDDSLGAVPGMLSGGVRAWLVSHGSGLTADGIALSAAPLGAVVLLVALVVGMSLRSLAGPVDEAGDAAGTDVVPYIAVTAVTYGILAGVLSAATNSGGYATHFMRSVLGGVVVGGVGAAVGVAVKHRGAGLRGRGEIVAVLRAATRGLLALLSAALVLVTLLFARQFGRASDMWAALDPGVVGSIGLAALCLAVLPNLVLWAAAVLVGPGFALGVDTSVDLTGAHLGAVPGLPILAGLPGPGAFPGWIFLLGLIPLLAGAYAGWAAADAVDKPWPELLGLGAAAGALAGLLCGALVAVSGGAVGPGRMAVTGPPAVTSTLAAVAVLAFGGVLGATLRIPRRHLGARRE